MSAKDADAPAASVQASALTSSGSSVEEGEMLLLSVSNLKKPASGREDACLPKQSDFSPKLGQSCQSEPESLNSSISSSSSVFNAAAPCNSAQGTSQDSSSNSPVIDKSGIMPGANSTGGRRSTVTDLEGALASLQKKLTEKDMEIAQLSRIRENVESELEDLTASLFEEAHKMVHAANVKQSSSEKALAEALMKIEGLETEVTALKTLVLTSTPSQPNKHLHPQLAGRTGSASKGDKQKANASVTSSKSTSSLKLNGVRKEPVSRHESKNDNRKASNDSLKATEETRDVCQMEARNIDPTVRKDFITWMKSPTLSVEHPFMAKIFSEEIDPCLSFPNAELSSRVCEAIHHNVLSLTPVKDFNNVPRNCALLNAPVLSRFILHVGLLASEDDESPADASKEETFLISQLARNRVASVCDCLNYLRYIQKGLVKAHVNDVYWEIMRLRKNVTLARLGYAPE